MSINFVVHTCTHPKECYFSRFQRYQSVVQVIMIFDFLSQFTDQVIALLSPAHQKWESDALLHCERMVPTDVPNPFSCQIWLRLTLNSKGMFKFTTSSFRINYGIHFS